MLTVKDLPDIYNNNPDLLWQIAKHCLLLHSKLVMASTNYCKYNLQRRIDIVEHFQQIIVDAEATVYYLGDRPHREDDRPAKIYSEGIQEWHYNGKVHRENDLPAVIYSNGAQEENDKPAVIYPNGTRYWYYNDKIHSENGKPTVIYSDCISS